MKDKNIKTALKTAEEIKKGKLTAEDVFNESRQKAIDSDLNDFLYVAESIDRTDNPQSAVNGITVAVKDNITVKNMPLTCGSKILEGYTPVYDATVVKRLKEAGVSILGKTNLDEFGMGSSGLLSAFGKVVNPIDKTRITGGSSSGSAAAVASGTVTAALGTDTGGSIRVPAALCGAVGFKPSYGAVSRYGLVAHASSLDTVGVIAKTVGDCAALTDIISGKDELDGTTHDVKLCCLENYRNGINGKRVCFFSDAFNFDGMSKEIKERVMLTKSAFEECGATVEFDTFGEFNLCALDYMILSSVEASSNLQRYDGVKYGKRLYGDTVDDGFSATRGYGFGIEVKKRILFGALMLSGEYFEKGYIAAAKHRRIVNNKLDVLFNKYDLIVTPTVPVTAPENHENESHLDIFTYPASLCGLPAVTVPLKTDGLPIGLQIFGKRFCDSEVLSAGEAIMKAEGCTDA